LKGLIKRKTTEIRKNYERKKKGGKYGLRTGERTFAHETILKKNIKHSPAHLGPQGKERRREGIIGLMTPKDYNWCMWKRELEDANSKMRGGYFL